MSNRYEPNECNCGGSGWQQGKDELGRAWAYPCSCMAEKQKTEVSERLLRHCGVPAKYRGCTLDNFQVNPKNEAAYNATKVFVSGDGLPSLAIVGIPNNGKTHLLTAAIMELAASGNDAIYISVAELLAQMRLGMQPGLPFDESTEWIINRYKKVAILALDDWGANQVTDWASARFDEIISYRDAENMRTIVASNMAESDFPERARSRLAGRGWSEFVTNSGESHG